MAAAPLWRCRRDEPQLEGAAAADSLSMRFFTLCVCVHRWEGLVGFHSGKKRKEGKGEKQVMKTPLLYSYMEEEKRGGEMHSTRLNDLITTCLYVCFTISLHTHSDTYSFKECRVKFRTEYDMNVKYAL